jgi:hypothetical protein
MTSTEKCGRLGAGSSNDMPRRPPSPRSYKDHRTCKLVWEMGDLPLRIVCRPISEARPDLPLKTVDQFGYPEGIRYPSSILKGDQIINQSEFTRTILRAPCRAPIHLAPSQPWRAPGRPKIPRQEGEACAYAWVYAKQLLTPLRLELASYCRSPLGRPWSSTTLCFKCFSCFRLMLQVFYRDVTKVDL